MFKETTIAIALASITAATPVAAATYSESYQSGPKLLHDGNSFAGKAVRILPVGGAAPKSPRHRFNFRDLVGVTSVALGTALDASFQSFCAARQANCGGVGFAVVTNAAWSDRFEGYTAKDLFSAYLVKGKSRTTIANVPEPANWALWIVGFGALGLMQRRRALRAV